MKRTNSNILTQIVFFFFLQQRQFRQNANLRAAPENRKKLPKIARGRVVVKRRSVVHLEIAALNQVVANARLASVRSVAGKTFVAPLENVALNRVDATANLANAVNALRNEAVN